MVKRYKLDAYDNLVCKEDGYLIYYEDYQALEAENKRLREALEDLYSMASSPQWRNEPLYRICELVEKALDWE